MRRRSLLAAGAGAGATTLLAACSSTDSAGSTGPARTHGRTTVTYGMWDQAQLPGMKKIMAAFEKANPDVHVDIQLTPWSSYWTTLKTSMRGGTAPDVFWMNAVNIQLYAANHVLEPLDPYIKRDRFDLAKHPSSLTRLYSYQGRHYGVPKDFDTVGLWYNKRLFDKAGIKHPDSTWTWDTVRDAARELTDRKRLVYGMASDLDRQSKFYPTIFQAGGWVIRGDRSGFDDPRTIDGLRFWTGLVDKGWAPPQSVVAESTSRNMFLSAKVAMNYDLSAMASIYHGDPVMKDEAGVTVLPRGRHRATVIHGLGHVLSAKSRAKDAAWRLIKFLGGKQAAEIQAREGVTISSYSGSQESWIRSMPHYDLRSFVDELAYAVPYPRSKNTAVWENAEYDILGAPLSGRQSIDSAAKTLADTMNRALKDEEAIG